ncbi:hypothetical protein HMPREF9137_1231 [Prevotella denticola F0289]|nr:hypothetical protein HMPREF9137_1231 [Prevotella denticola F0289]
MGLLIQLFPFRVCMLFFPPSLSFPVSYLYTVSFMLFGRFFVSDGISS